MSQYRTEIRRLMIAVNEIDGVYDMIAKKIGVKMNTLALLYALDDGRPHSQKEICAEWLIPPTTLNTIVRETVAAGYLHLNSSAGKKEKTLCLTEKGSAFARTVLNQVYELEQNAMARTLHAVSPAFISSLELFTQHMKEEVRTFSHESEHAF